jgi:hypothetical protein
MQLRPAPGAGLFFIRWTMPSAGGILPLTEVTVAGILPVVYEYFIAALKRKPPTL